MSPSLPIFKDLKLLKLSELFELRLLTSVFDSVNKSSPSCFHDFFLLNSCVHQYSTRQASQGDLYLFRKNSLQYGLKSIRYLGAKLWNTLPIELRNSPSKTSFKVKLKIHLLNKVNQLPILSYKISLLCHIKSKRANFFGNFNYIINSHSLIILEYWGGLSSISLPIERSPPSNNSLHTIYLFLYYLFTRKLRARFARASTFLAPAESFLTTSDNLHRSTVTEAL